MQKPDAIPTVYAFVIVIPCYCLLLWYLAASHNPTFLEQGHLPSGLLHLKHGEFSTCQVNPPLVRMIAAVPLLFRQPNVRWRYYNTLPTARSEHALGYDFVFANGTDVYKLYFIARACCFIFTVLGALAIFYISLNLLGKNSAWISLLLWVFSPYLLGHGALITTETANATLYLLVLLIGQRWLKKINLSNTLWLGIILGVSNLVKFTSLLLYPILFVLLLMHGIFYRDNNLKIKLLSFASIIFISAVVINLGYGFCGSCKKLGAYTFYTTCLGGKEPDGYGVIPPGNRFVGTPLENLIIPFPKDYIQGIDLQKRDFETGLDTSYLRGEHSRHGWWYYYAYALLVKMPLGTWGLLGLTVVCTFCLRGYNANWKDEIIVIFPGIILFGFVSSQTGFSVHSRYIIPALPFLFVWISKIGQCFTREIKQLNPHSTPVIRTLTTFFLVWIVASSLWVYPHSLSYFNELAAVLPTPYDDRYPQSAPPTTAKEKTAWQKIKHVLNAGPMNGPRHLLDSNIDWGQDLFHLESWFEANPDARPFQVAYWGSYPLEFSKIESAGNPPINPQPGWYALSVNEIYNRSMKYHYFLNFEPIATAGYSIYIYHVTLDDANRVREKLGLPMIKNHIAIAEPKPK